MNIPLSLSLRYLSTRLILSLLIALYFACLLEAQPVIYNDATSIISGTWDENGTLSELNGTDTPYEGEKHYEFSYNYNEYWSGIGLNLDNWGTTTGYDFSAYTHLQIAYRGMNDVQEITIELRDGSTAGNTITLGEPTADYTVIEVPLFALAAGTNLALDNLTELVISVTGGAPNGSGNLYLDEILLVNNSSGTTTSAATWQRANAMQRGVNYSNWLEAFWLMPFGAYPDEDKFSASMTADFRNLGFDAIRLPVTFEMLADEVAPYTLDTDNLAFDLIEDAIGWAETYDMKLIIDMHHGEDLTDDNYQAKLPRMKAIWEQLMVLYADLDPSRYLFEVYNEPFAISNANFRTVASELVDVVRAAGATHSIIVGATGYNGANDLLSFTPLDDPDIIYTFHFYDPFAFTHQQLDFTNVLWPERNFPINDDIALVTAMINGVGEWSAYYDAPVVAGELGVSMNAAADDRCNWINTIAMLLEENMLPWFYWGAIDVSDGFGFFENGVVSVPSMTPCFGTALGLPATVLAVDDLGNLMLDCDQGERILSWNITSDEPAQLTIEGFAAETENWEAITEFTVDPQRTRYAYHLAVNDKSSLYRLHIRELDGTEHYSNVAVNNCPEGQSWRVFPNPTHSGGVNLKGMMDGPTDIVLYNSTGQEVMRQQREAFMAGQSKFIPFSLLPPGVYWLRVYQGGQKVHWEKIVIGG